MGLKGRRRWNGCLSNVAHRSIKLWAEHLTKRCVEDCLREGGDVIGNAFAN